MGYYTSYKIEVIAGNEPAMWRDRLADISGYIDCVSVKVKWYDHSESMIKLSYLFPGVTFQVTGYGEENGDVWRKYYRSGIEQVAETKIVHSPCTL